MESGFVENVCTTVKKNLIVAMLVFDIYTLFGTIGSQILTKAQQTIINLSAILTSVPSVFIKLIGRVALSHQSISLHEF